MDQNGTKCKGLHEYIEFLKDNEEVENVIICNLQKYKDGRNKNIL
jgi:hypothetical protein